jgi:hypothetical protein
MARGQIAEVLGELRTSLKASGPPRDTNAAAAHDRKLIYFTQLETIDRIAIEIFQALKKKHTRLDRARFLGIVGVRR